MINYYRLQTPGVVLYSPFPSFASTLSGKFFSSRAQYVHMTRKTDGNVVSIGYLRAVFWTQQVTACPSHFPPISERSPVLDMKFRSSPLQHYFWQNVSSPHKRVRQSTGRRQAQVLCPAAISLRPCVYFRKHGGGSDVTTKSPREMSAGSTRGAIIQHEWHESQEGREFFSILLRRNRRKMFGEGISERLPNLDLNLPPHAHDACINTECT